MLSEFRDRLVADRAPRRLQEAGLLVRPGGQRTDSTHVLAAVRRLNRVENTAEHLRSALNALAAAAGDWLRRTVPADWFDRYQRRIETTDCHVVRARAGSTCSRPARTHPAADRDQRSSRPVMIAANSGR
ncbi:hypothetical protein [Streptomyces muensis]|uniref:Transposase n=1 Tax=Streptomyces muensis TaxID=1077944 RepID=A0A9X1TIC9_STRM4|nr:hypothetical protein [Streptomyces muensis]MCF1592092.1 hypothetical protein [Streptomyces muensis]